MGIHALSEEGQYLYSLWETGEPIVYPKYKPLVDYTKHEPVVYFVEDREGLIKIGYTTALLRRKAEIEIEHGPLNVRGWMWGGKEMESVLHERFKVWRLGQSEWFLPNPELDQLIAHGQ